MTAQAPKYQPATIIWRSRKGLVRALRRIRDLFGPQALVSFEVDASRYGRGVQASVDNYLDSRKDIIRTAGGALTLLESPGWRQAFPDGGIQYRITSWSFGSVCSRGTCETYRRKANETTAAHRRVGGAA